MFPWHLRGFPVHRAQDKAPPPDLRGRGVNSVIIYQPARQKLGTTRKNCWTLFRVEAMKDMDAPVPVIGVPRFDQPPVKVEMA